MDERLRFIARLLDGEKMASLCEEFGISRKTGYKVFERYQDAGLIGLTGRSRRPHRHANQLPMAVEKLIVRLKMEYPSWGAPKLRERLRKRWPEVACPAISTVHAVLDRHGLVQRRRRRPRPRLTGTPLTRPLAPNALWCADYKGEFLLANREDIRDVVEVKLALMLQSNPLRMDYYKRCQEIVVDYNREKDRATVEDTFAQLVQLAASLDAEQRRAVEEGLSDDELALFDLLFREGISQRDRERLKQASKSLLASLQQALAFMRDWTQNASTQAEVKVLILDGLWLSLPRPPFTDDDTEQLAERVLDFVWQRTGAQAVPSRQCR